MNQTEFNVWDTQKFFQNNGKLPEMTKNQTLHLLDFADCQVSDSIESYERFAHNHGGTGVEAKERLAAISTAEKLRTAVREALYQ